MAVDEASPGAAPRFRLGPYDVARCLGRGGMADVFEALHVDLGKRVAVKILRSPVGADGENTRRVLREGRAATAVRHPNVVEMLDVGFQDGIAYLVMDLLEGEDLSVRLARTGPMPVAEIADLLLPVVSGMAAAHAAGVIHRDLKPSNIFLARRHHGIEPVVVDFGISKSIDGAAGTGSSQVGAGTVPYMAPEQVRGSRDVTALCDVYALGAILYECATGRTPFWSEDRYELIQGIMTGPVVPPSERNPLVGPAFDAIVLRALAREPGDRFPDVSALGAALWPLAGEKARERWADEFGSIEAGLRSGGVAVTVRPPGWARAASRGRTALRAAGALSILALAAASVLASAGLTSSTRPASGPTGQSAAAATWQPPTLSPSSTTASVATLVAPSPVVLPEAPAAAAPRAVEATPPPRPAHTTVPAAVRRDPQHAPAAGAATVERGTANIPIVE
jgi:serine/threonine-protein kinase